MLKEEEIVLYQKTLLIHTQFNFEILKKKIEPYVFREHALLWNFKLCKNLRQSDKSINLDKTKQSNEINEQIVATINTKSNPPPNPKDRLLSLTCLESERDEGRREVSVR